MDEQKDKTDDSEMSRNNKSEYNSFVAAYKAAYSAMPHGQVLKETTANWQNVSLFCLVLKLVVDCITC